MPCRLARSGRLKIRWIHGYSGVNDRRSYQTGQYQYESRCTHPLTVPVCHSQSISEELVASTCFSFHNRYIAPTGSCDGTSTTERSRVVVDSW